MPIVKDEIKLYIGVAGPREERVVQGIRLGCDELRVSFTIGVLRFGGFEGDEPF